MNWDKGFTAETQRRIPLRLCGVLSILLLAAFSAFAQLPAVIGDPEFWRIVTDFSETGGVFQAEYMSNEDSAQSVIPALKQRATLGGVYMGVGPEQNFTYIAAIQPKLAFVIDIRRDNMLELLMYKAIFELSSGRADFISRLFSRPRPQGLDASSSVQALFDAYRTVEADANLYEKNLSDVMNFLVNVHKFALSDADKAAVTRIATTFRNAGPDALKGSGDKNATYAQIMTGADPSGSQQSYLASEENFAIVQNLQKENRIIPLVGDFAGDKAIVSVGRYLKDHNAVVDVFYVSNVERYLFDQGEHGKRFYTNVASLPQNASSLFIRSVTVDISRRLSIPIPDGPANWRSFLFPMSPSIKAFDDGRLKTYRDLFEVVSPL